VGPGVAVWYVRFRDAFNGSINVQSGAGGVDFRAFVSKDSGISFESSAVQDSSSDESS
jgi:hypothetical protein